MYHTLYYKVSLYHSMSSWNGDIANRKYFPGQEVGSQGSEEVIINLSKMSMSTTSKPCTPCRAALIHVCIYMPNNNSFHTVCRPSLHSTVCVNM